jgi:hypothetical protein
MMAAELWLRRPGCVCEFRCAAGSLLIAKLKSRQTPASDKQTNKQTNKQLATKDRLQAAPMTM